MKCKFHPQVASIAECSNCAIPLCGICADFTSANILCNPCTAANESSKYHRTQRSKTKKFEQLIAEKKGKLKSLDRSIAAKKAKEVKRDKRHLTLMSGCCLFIAWRLFASLNSPSTLTAAEMRDEDLLRDQLDLCIQNFWAIGEVLQRNRLPSDSLNCEGAIGSYVILNSGDDIIVNHPNPESLGYSEIFISKNNPVPTLVLAD